MSAAFSVSAVGTSAFWAAEVEGRLEDQLEGSVESVKGAQLRCPTVGPGLNDEHRLTYACLGGRMEFRLLGPIEVWHDDQRVDLGRASVPKARCVLAVLAHSAGDFVPVSRLVERVWGAYAPGEGSRYKYVGWLRDVLMRHGVDLTCRDGGYVLAIDPVQVDLTCFRRLVEQSRRAEADQARVLIDRGLELWRGAPLTGIQSDWADHLRGGLEMELQAAEVLRFAAVLAHDPSAEVVARLTTWITDHPPDEQATRLAMTALYQSGQTTRALQTYRDHVDRQRCLYGIDATTELQRLYEDIQSGRAPHASAWPILASSSRPATTGRSGDPRPALSNPPRQLPPVTSHFCGRLGEIADLDQQLGGTGTPGSTVIGIIAGPAGIGKTALALTWAHRATDRFPDGQIYVNFRGYSPSDQPASRAEVVRDLLAAMGVSAQHVPVGFDAQLAVYRSLVAGRCMMFVFDNVREADQVRSLLPPGQGSAVLITSRDLLTGLQAADGAHLFRLGPLSTSDAADLLARRLGHERVRPESSAIDQMIRLCAGLPLAINVVAARAQSMTGSLRQLADELLARGLAGLALEDAMADPRSVFSWSYQALSQQAATAFVLLGCNPLPQASLPALASLAGWPLAASRDAATELSRSGLVEEQPSGRFRLHDLIHAYARELFERMEDRDRASATRRLIDHYLHTGMKAESLANPTRPLSASAAPTDGVQAYELATAAESDDWFAVEHRTLIVMIGVATATGYHQQAAEIAMTLATFLDKRGYWEDYASTHTTALAAARRGCDLATQARAHAGLGRAYIQLGDHHKAVHHLHRALSLFADAGDLLGQARTHVGLARAHHQQGHRPAALSHARQALHLYEESGDEPGIANALNAVGFQSARNGDHAAAVDFCSRALTIQMRLGAELGIADAWDSLGYAYHHRHEYQRAIECFEHALHLLEAHDHRYYQADTLTHLGDTYDELGDTSTARHHWQRALTILTGLGHPDAEAVRARLLP
jgi:tetratricopeptide (TPR) repeat protein/DNA-binding SARP family transcriptional activator